MDIAITGGTGLVGSAVARALLEDGHRVVILTRDATKAADRVPPGATAVAWPPGDSSQAPAILDGVDAVIALAGAPVGPLPWTRGRRRTILGSRTLGVRGLIDAMGALPAGRRASTLVVVSGVDIYRETDEAEQDPSPSTEASPTGTGFLADVAIAVEAEADRAAKLGVRVVKMRMGHILHRDANLVRILALPVRLFVGGRFGSGRQWLSWIHLDDAVSIYRLALTDPTVAGPVNVVSPNPVRQRAFVKAIGAALHRPTWFPVPAFLLRLVMREQSSLLLGSRRVAPAAAEAHGITFRHPTIDEAFAEILG